jgi:membrane-bound lytic murein transglycosylase B
VSLAELRNPDVEDLPGTRLERNETVGSLKLKGVEFAALAPSTAPALFIALRGMDGPTYRVGYHNFWVITRYNRSPMYALAVTELASAIAATPNTEAASESTNTGRRTPRRP